MRFRVVLATALAIVTSVALSIPALASSNGSNSGTLPGTCDYINTNTWLGNMFWGNQFGFRSSSQLIGTCPWNPYEISDINSISVNGVAASIGVGSSVSGSFNISGSTATFQSDSYNNWFAGNSGSAIANTCCWISNYSLDYSRVVVWAGTTTYWNPAATTNYF
jgi:hypothetical protein